MADYVQIKGDALMHECAGSVSTFDLNMIAIVGEFTTEEGPFDEDHFMVLIGKDDSICEFPVGCNGYLQVVEEIAGRIHIPNLKNSLMLLGCTQFESRILWPASICGRPIYRWYKAYTNFFGFKFACFFTLERNLSEDVNHYISKRKNEESARCLGCRNGDGPAL